MPRQPFLVSPLYSVLPMWLTSTVGSLGGLHGGQPHCALEACLGARLDVVLGTGCSGDTGGRGPVGPGGLGGFPTLLSLSTWVSLPLPLRREVGLCPHSPLSRARGGAETPNPGPSSPMTSPSPHAITPSRDVTPRSRHSPPEPPKSAPPPPRNALNKDGGGGYRRSRPGFILPPAAGGTEAGPRSRHAGGSGAAAAAAAAAAGAGGAGASQRGAGHRRRLSAHRLPVPPQLLLQLRGVLPQRWASPQRHRYRGWGQGEGTRGRGAAGSPWPGSEGGLSPQRYGSSWTSGCSGSTWPRRWCCGQ